MPNTEIKKVPLTDLGYGFVPKEYLGDEEDEYTLRNMQNRSGIAYRHLNAYEIEALVRNRNTSDDWNKIFVSDAFSPELVRNCKFYGLVRIGKLESVCLSYSDLIVPVGLYNSNIISCDFGDNVSIDNVNYLSHYILGNEVMVANVNELVTTSKCKFGNGIIKQGEQENVRIWLEVCNENGGRKIMPFNGMLAGDAWLWSRYREDELLLDKFKAFTQSRYTDKQGYYGKIGDGTVIKNCRIIKDVWVGDSAYIKGANKLKNLTINSRRVSKTQIGEGVELVNGSIGEGCRIFYGVKAVRFVMASNSQLKYGARLINSYLGNNATISCCEVLNSLIFPAHEQHHNNSFLCAALIMGQSNIAAGATLGSNHNSRSPDGELLAGRGFWPGLCVSLKHNSRFASFTILTKGDYKNELNIPIPFSLVNNDVSKDVLEIMPGYWFLYNMYALARNCWKYVDRDKRIEKTQHIEYDYLAPDTINEMFDSLVIMEKAVGKAYFERINDTKSADELACIKKGKLLFAENNPLLQQMEILVDGFENTKRKNVIIKTWKAYPLFVELIGHYGIKALANIVQQYPTLTDALQSIPKDVQRTEWLNVGGQLIPRVDVDNFRASIRNGEIDSWEDVHRWYEKMGGDYNRQKTAHALASLREIRNISLESLNKDEYNRLLNQLLETEAWMLRNIIKSREKDYTNPYRTMMYASKEEMDNVLGTFEDNGFIYDSKKQFEDLKDRVNLWVEQYCK